MGARHVVLHRDLHVRMCQVSCQVSVSGLRPFRMGARSVVLHRGLCLLHVRRCQVSCQVSVSGL